MIFTSIISKINQTASELFREYHNNTDVPCAVSDARIYPLDAHTGPKTSFVKSRLGHLIGAVMKPGAKVYVDQAPPSIKEELAKHISPFPTPQMGVSFGAQNNKETITAKMEDIGFVKVASGRSSYYLGGGSPQNMKVCSQMGADADCYVGQAHTNLKGIITFNILSYVAIALASLPSDSLGTFLHEEDSDMDDTKLSYLEVEERESPWVKRSIVESLGQDGHFFPYFSGLVLPDKNIVPRVASHIISELLSDSVKTMTTIIKGWSSLCTTEAGLVLSHIYFGIEMAMRTDATIRFYVAGDSYNGFILLTRTGFLKNTTLHSALEAEALGKEILEFDSHEASLAKICAMISKVPLMDKSEKDVDPRIIVTPRQLHDHLRERSFTTEQMAQISQLLSKLNFTQVYWDATNVDQIVLTINAIGDNKFLGNTQPIAYKTNVMFTKDLVMSTLAAFGNRVPTLSDRGEYSLTIPKKTDTMFTGKVGGMLPGFGIFVKPLQQGVESWKDMRKTGVITFNGNIRKEGIHYRNARGLIGKDTEKGLALKRALVQHFSIASQDKKERKRKREERDVEQEEERAAKRHARELEDNDILMDIYS